MLALFNRLFPLWAILLSVLALYFQDFFAALEGLIVLLLAAVMFLMGLTLQAEDFKRIINNPQPVLVGVALQFLLMPLAAITLATALQLNTQLTAGMVLVGCC
ncbi:MAG: bile acid:sodium symporter, partial [Gammaproteobacteria bacterium]